MRKLIAPVLAFVLGITVALVIYKFALTERPNAARETGGPGMQVASPPPAAPTGPERHAAAWKLLRGGQLQDAQDAFLGILSLNLEDQDALRGLVAVRRQMTRDDPAVLRRQAAAYEDAIRRRVETEEHYTLPAMEALVAANLQAVQEIEAHSEPVARPLRNATEASTPPAAPLAEEEVPPSGKLPPSASHSAKPIGPRTPDLSRGKLPPPVTRSAKPAQKPDVSTAPTLKAAAKPPSAPTPPPPVAPIPQTSPSPAAPAAQASPPPAAPAPKASPPPAAPAPQVSPPATSGPQTPPPTAASAATWGLSSRPSPPPAASAPPTSPPTAASAATWGLSPRPSPPPAEPSASSNNRLYMVRVGPVSDRDRAAAIAKQLSAGGFSQTKVTTLTVFRVVSEPLPRSVAEGLMATLAGRGFHGQIEPLTGDSVQLLFGVFSGQKDAETLSQRIAAAGYDAWVREGAVYTLQLGPYPQSAVNTITGIVKSGAPGATVTADLVP